MHRFKKLGSAVLPILAFSSGVFAAPASLEQQRVIYQKAQNYLDKKQVDEYLEIRDLISDYPLTPYVDYRTFLIDIGKRTPEEVDAFTEKYRYFPFSNNIRSRYLDALIAKEKWNDLYQYQADEPRMEKYQCSYYYARLKNGEKEQAFKGAEKLWLSGKSVSDNCEGLFKEWQQAGYRTDDMVLRRMLLSFEKNSNNLINYLAKMPTDKQSIQQAKEIKLLAKNPENVIEFSQKYPASDFNRKKSQIALKKLARKDIDLAQRALPIVFKAQDFSVDAQQNVSDYLAVRLFNTEELGLAEWRDKVLTTSKSLSALEQRIRLAIRQADWQGVSDWIVRLPQDEKDSLRWQFWLGRSELELGNRNKGIERLQGLLGKRNFYSVAAAKTLDKPVLYQVSNEKPATEILKPYSASLVRINELIEVEKIAAAKSEWNWLLWQVGSKEKEALAVYAAKKKWHHLSVKATIEAKMWDNTALRFPLAHQWWFNFYAEKHNIDPITLMSVARQESAMDVEARSPVGARGIMQIMPKTAKYTAKKYKIKYKGTSELYDVGKNIEIGSHYLNGLLKQYDNNRIFAFAAYNAGPHRVKVWRERSNQQLDAFAFIEAIPFKETRGYVQNILMFETYYRNIMKVDGEFLHSNEISTKY
ncbi:murein transglycosylase [Vibrio algarum]|uniref:Murein transglycosylase n=1 Tax=Vibrio algarum TaxID=3020714 RepID=A0ABT4YTB9_9VIBR|nr:murein transglycosylase [Vibrio sp. KJ40-1]MDB1124801.1 murein transglycosylase [Vibrio sp. KJ40-1]